MNGISGIGAVVPAIIDSGKKASVTPAFRDALNEASGDQTKQKIAGAAKQFEALMIGQILKSSNGPEGWLNAGDDDQTASTAIEMAEEYLGQAISNGGGLGIAKLVVNGLDRSSTPASSATQAVRQTPSHTDSQP